MCYFLQSSQCAEQSTSTGVCPFDALLSAESTETMQIKCLAQGHNIFMKPKVELLISLSRYQLLTNMTPHKDIQC